MKLVAKADITPLIKGVTYQGVRIGHGKVLVRIDGFKHYFPLSYFKIKKD